MTLTVDTGNDVCLNTHFFLIVLVTLNLSCLIAGTAYEEVILVC